MSRGRKAGKKKASQASYAPPRQRRVAAAASNAAGDAPLKHAPAPSRLGAAGDSVTSRGENDDDDVDDDGDGKRTEHLSGAERYYADTLEREQRSARVRPVAAPGRASSADLAALLLLTALACVTRFYQLHVPRAVVFDEFHFGKFVNWYFRGEYFFDIHPPLGKLLLALGAIASGGKKDASFEFDNIGAAFPTMTYVGPRFVAALFGTLVVPLTYVVCRKFRMSVDASVLGAALVLLDICFLIESRLILVDSQVIFFSALTLYCMLELWNTLDGTRERAKWVVLTGLACGCAISIKWTALATPGLTGLVSLFGNSAMMGRRRRIPIWQCMAIGLLALSLYTGTFAIHFWLLPRSGQGDEFMPNYFQRTLLGNKHFDAAAPSAPFWTSFLYLNAEMFRANARITARHAWESKWYTWPLTRRGLLYWVSDATDAAQHGDYAPRVARIYLLFNPAVAWGTYAALIAFIGAVVWRWTLAAMPSRPQRRLVAARARTRPAVRARTRNRTAERYWRVFFNVGLFFIAAWMLNVLPYVGVQRCAFLYHYLPGIYYAILLAAWMADRGVPSLLARRLIVLVSLSIVGVLFAYFSPWAYGMYMTEAQHSARRWLDGWH